jgi:hypothetical protein
MSSTTPERHYRENVQHLGGAGVAGPSVDVFLGVTFWGQEWGGDADRGAVTGEQHGQRGGDSSAAERLPYADGT